MADFNFYLNRQGVQGRKGDQGEQGFSPVISVNSETANEYTLRIQNEDYEFITPNLRGNHIEYTGGTYIRINPETEQLYTGLIDQATTSTYGGVILAADGALETGTDYNGVVSAGDIHDYVESKISEAGLNFDDLTNSLVAGDNITLDIDSTNETITINSNSGSNYTAGSNINITNNVISAENVVTTNTTQTINLFEGNNRIFKTFRESGLTSSVGDSCIRFYNSDNGVNHIISIGQNGYGGVSRGGIVAKGGSGALLGTNGTNSSCIFLPPSNSNPVIIKGKPEPFSSSDLDGSYPIWNESIVSAGNGVSITATGTGVNKTYTISATGGDLSNYVTLDTTQYITGEKNFNRNLPSSGTTNVCLRAGSTSSLITHNMTMAINSAGVPVLSTNGAHCGTYIGNANGMPICFLKRPDNTGYGMPSVCIQYESQLASNEYTQSNTYPLFNALNFTAGSGVTITPTGTGAGTTYEISTTGTITVDNALDLTSTNPVQNAVITQALDDINDVIPAQASASNQLADKNFVNSSIATNTANFIGTFNSLADLEAYTGTVTNNDYAFVTTADAQGNTVYNRYKYNADTQTWIFEYALNNTGFTAAQMAAINSGATSTNIGQISTNTSNIGTIQTTLSGFGNIVTHNVNEFATASQGSLADTALQPNDNISELTNDSGYITSASLPTVDQTYNSSSTNAQSGVAIEGAGFLKNTATQSDSLYIFGHPALQYSSCVAIGKSSSVWADGCVSIGYLATANSMDATAVGDGAFADGYYSVAIGSNSRTSNANYAIQLGMGTNSTANTLQVRSFPLMETNTGYIFGARIPVDGTTITLDSNNNLSAVAQTPTVIDGGEETIPVNYYGWGDFGISTTANVWTTSLTPERGDILYDANGNDTGKTALGYNSSNNSLSTNTWGSQTRKPNTDYVL